MFATAVLVFNACKTELGPEQTTERFMNHLAQQEYDKAAEYATESTMRFIEMMEALQSLGGEFMDDEEIELLRAADIDCEVDNDTAICRFEEDDEMAEVNLLKKQGVWLVDMQKDTPFDEMDWDEDADWETDADWD